MPVCASFLLTAGCNIQDEDFGATASGDEISLNSEYTGVELGYEAVLLGGCDGEMMRALTDLIPTISGTVTDNTRLLIVPSLNGMYEKEIETVYNNGGVIAVVNPKRDNLDQWFATHDWYGNTPDDKIEKALIYSFNYHNHRCAVCRPGDDFFIVTKEDIESMPDRDSDNFFFSHLAEAEEPATSSAGRNVSEEDVITEFDDRYNDMYTTLSPWIERVDHALDNPLSEDDMLQSSSDKESDNVDDIFSLYHYGRSFSFSANKEVRKLPSSNADYITGNGSVTVSFDIHQIHCYDSQPGHGDYYLVDMTASISNQDMYKGRWWNIHGGTYVRICGFYGKSFEIECAPVNYETKRLVTTDYVNFTSEGSPVPQTVQGQTTYESSKSFNLSLSASVSGSRGREGGHRKNSAGGDGKISMGWNWSKSETRTIADTDIANTSTGNIVGYKLVFNNLPHYDWDQYRGFWEGNSLTYRSTSSIRALWVWYVKSEYDDTTVPPIGIRFRAKPTYGSMTFITTKADLETKTYNDIGNVEYFFKLDDFIRDRCGDVQLMNNLDTPIRDIRLYRMTEWMEKGAMALPVWMESTLINPLNSIHSPESYKVNESYIMFFTSQDGKTEYKISTPLYLSTGNVTKLRTKDNFETVTE